MDKIKNCKRCGKEFVSKKGDRQKFCTDMCRRTFYSESRQKENPPICKECGKLFDRRIANQKYCSQECISAHMKQVRKERKDERKPKALRVCKTMSPLAADEAAARASGMHYGQWRAAKDFGMRI